MIGHGKPTGEQPDDSSDVLGPAIEEATLIESDIQKEFADKFQPRIRQIYAGLGRLGLLAKYNGYRGPLKQYIGWEVANSGQVIHVIDGLTDAVAVLDSECGTATGALPVLGPLFTPLQIEAFALAKDLRQFIAEAEPRPPIRLESGDVKNDEMVQFVEWHTRLASGYERRFKDRVNKLRLKMGERRLVSSSELLHWNGEPLNEIDLLVCVQARLERLALALISPGEPRFTKAEIEAMSPATRRVLDRHQPNI